MEDEPDSKEVEMPENILSETPTAQEVLDALEILSTWYVEYNEIENNLKQKFDSVRGKKNTLLLFKGITKKKISNYFKWICT